MAPQWKTKTLKTVEDILDALFELQGKRWLCRGQSRAYGTLIPSIDRSPRRRLDRTEKLALERRCINVFRSHTKFFAFPGEQAAMTDDIIALAVLRHYGTTASG